MNKEVRPYKNTGVGYYPEHLQSKTGTERHRQDLYEQHCAYSTQSRFLRVWNFKCEDGEFFSAIAPSESGAVRVLNSERPGMLARFLNQTTFKFRN